MYALRSLIGVLTGILYLLLGWRLTEIVWEPTYLFGLFTQSTLRLALIVAIYLAFYYFTVGGRMFRFLWGALVHGSAHIFAALWLADRANQWCGLTTPESLTTWMVALCRLSVLYMGGHLIGSFIMGLYLLVSLNLWRHHHNEAFSSLRIKNFKNFLRIRINPDGSLEVFPIGVPSLNKQPILIEGPVTIVPA